MSNVEMQYGGGRVDWGHLEVTPLSRAAVGIYLPLPRSESSYVPLPSSESKLLLAYRRGVGIEVDVR